LTREEILARLAAAPDDELKDVATVLRSRDHLKKLRQEHEDAKRAHGSFGGAALAADGRDEAAEAARRKVN
jgi:hypothetical protein